MCIQTGVRIALWPIADAAGIGAPLIPLEGEAPSYTALIGPDGELLIGAAALSIYDAVTPDVLPAMLASLTARTALPATTDYRRRIIPESVLQALVDALTALIGRFTLPRRSPAQSRSAGGCFAASGRAGAEPCRGQHSLPQV